MPAKVGGAGLEKHCGRPLCLLKQARISGIQRLLLGLRRAAIIHGMSYGRNELPSPSEETKTFFPFLFALCSFFFIFPPIVIMGKKCYCINTNGI